VRSAHDVDGLVETFGTAPQLRLEIPAFGLAALTKPLRALGDPVRAILRRSLRKTVLIAKLTTTTAAYAE